MVQNNQVAPAPGIGAGPDGPDPNDLADILLGPDGGHQLANPIDQPQMAVPPANNVQVFPGQDAGEDPDAEDANQADNADLDAEDAGDAEGAEDPAADDNPDAEQADDNADAAAEDNPDANQADDADLDAEDAGDAEGAEDPAADDGQAQDNLPEAVADDPGVAVAGGPAGGPQVVINLPGLGPAVAVIGPVVRPALVRPGHIWGPGFWVPAPVHAVPGVVLPANPIPVAANPPPAAGEPVPGNVLPEEEMTVVILNPEENGQEVSFLLAEQERCLGEAEYLDFTAAEPTVITFDRGGQFGTARYSLTEGVYEFRLTDQGWELYRKTFVVTLDNSANQTDFHYLADGEPFTVDGGQSQTHEGQFPVVVTFDRGDGGEPAEVALATGTYQIAVSPETELWDLFIAAEAE